MNSRIFDVFETCLAALEAGEDLDTILEPYPDLADELRPLLETTASALAIGKTQISSATIQRSRTRVLAHANQLRQSIPSGWALFQRFPRLAFILLLVIFFLVSGGGFAAVSAQSLPGDQLYPIKRAAENLQLDLSISLNAHQAMENQFQSRRVDEVEQLIDLGRQEFVEFHGEVQHQNADQWKVGGINVHLVPNTLLIGEIYPGMTVEVEGVTIPAGWVQAAEIHLQRFGFVGYIEAIDGETWRVGGYTMQITAATHIDTNLKIGDWVVVSAQSDDFGNLTALIIDAARVPTPTPAPIPDDETSSTTDDMKEIEESLVGDDNRIVDQEPETDDDQTISSTPESPTTAAESSPEKQEDDDDGTEKESEDENEHPKPTETESEDDASSDEDQDDVEEENEAEQENEPEDEDEDKKDDD